MSWTEKELVGPQECLAILFPSCELLVAAIVGCFSEEVAGNRQFPSGCFSRHEQLEHTFDSLIVGGSSGCDASGQLSGAGYYKGAVECKELLLGNGGRCAATAAGPGVGEIKKSEQLVGFSLNVTVDGRIDGPA